MASPKPVPLLDFDGVRQEREPWLTPNNAFQQLDDCYVYRGRLRKRPGSRWMHSLGEPVTENLTPGSTNYSGTLANLPFNVPHYSADRPIPSSDYNVRFVGVHSGAGGTMTIVVGSIILAGGLRHNYNLVDEGTTTNRGNIIWDPDNDSGTDGDYDVTFPYPCDVSIQIQYETLPQRAIVGFGRFVEADGTDHNLCFDTRRCWKLDGAEGWWYNEESGLGDIWSGAATDHFHLHPFDDILVINNGVDAPYKYDPSAGTTLTPMATNFDGSAGDDIDSAKMFFNVRGYGVWLAPTENGTAHPGRVRWTQNGDAEAYNSVNDFLDAPNNDIIVTAGLVAGELYVGFRDTGWWKFAFTGDPIGPFAWEPVESYLGAVAQNGTVEMSDRLLSRTRRGFVAVNRMGEVEIAPQIGDDPLSWNPEAAYLTQSLRVDQARQVWWTVAKGTETSPAHVVVLQQEQDGSEQFADWHFDFNALGSYRLSEALTWDDIGEVMDTLEWRIDSGVNLGSFPVTLGGDLTGNVYEVASSPSDSTGMHNDEVANSTQYTAISMLARSARINPFPGKQVRLGWVDVIADSSPSASLKLRFYADWEATNYAEKDVDLAATTSSTKVLRRVQVDRIATFHTIEVVDESKAGVVIDSLVPWFLPEGDMQEID